MHWDDLAIAHEASDMTVFMAGGHLNPAISIGLAVGGKVSVMRALLYIIAQCLGACTGAAIIRGVRG